MIKTNLKLKDTFTIYERADIVETIASAFFQENEDGTTRYTPYLKEFGMVIAISKYMIEGLEFDKDESIYNAVMTDEELREIVVSAFSDMDIFMEDVEKIVEYKKAENLAKIQNDANMYLAFKLADLVEKESEKNSKEAEVLDKLNVWLEEQKELSSMVSQEDYQNFVKNFDANAIINSAINKYGESELHKKNLELIETNKKLKSSENKVIEMKNALIKEQQKDSVKNVVADAPKKTRSSKTKTPKKVE